MKRTAITITLFSAVLFSFQPAEGAELYKVSEEKPTATLITNSPYKKTVRKGKYKKKQELMVLESRRECRPKPKKIKHTQWENNSVKIEAGVDLIIAQSKSGREGKSMMSCMTQVHVNLRADAEYRMEFDDDPGSCQFQLVNTADAEDMFNHTSPKPNQKTNASDDAKVTKPPVGSVGLKIVRKPNCDDL